MTYTWTAVGGAIAGGVAIAFGTSSMITALALAVVPYLYLTIPPNWAVPVRVNRYWKTGILTALRGNEQRAKQFSWSRFKTAYRISVVTYAQFAWLKRNFASFQDKVWGIPLWTDGVRIVSIAAAGQPFIPTQDTSYCRFSPLRRAIIIDFSDFTNFEVVEVKCAVSDGILCKSNLVNVWDGDYWVFPIIGALVQTDIVGDVVTDLDFDVVVDADESLVVYF